MSEIRSKSGAVVRGWCIRRGTVRGKGDYLHARDGYYPTRDPRVVMSGTTWPATADVEWLTRVARDNGGRVVPVVDPRTRPAAAQPVDQSLPVRAGDVVDVGCLGVRGAVESVADSGDVRFRWTGSGGDTWTSKWHQANVVDAFRTERWRFLSRGPVPAACQCGAAKALREVHGAIRDKRDGLQFLTGATERAALRFEAHSDTVGAIESAAARHGVTL